MSGNCCSVNRVDKHIWEDFKYRVIGCCFRCLVMTTADDFMTCIANGVSTWSELCVSMRFSSITCDLPTQLGAFLHRAAALTGFNLSHRRQHNWMFSEWHVCFSPLSRRSQREPDSA